MRREIKNLFSNNDFSFFSYTFFYSFLHLLPVHDFGERKKTSRNETRDYAKYKKAKQRPRREWAEKKCRKKQSKVFGETSNIVGRTATATESRKWNETATTTTTSNGATAMMELRCLENMEIELELDGAAASLSQVDVEAHEAIKKILKIIGI